MCTQVGHTLTRAKFKEFDEVLQRLIQRKHWIEEGIARGLLNSVLQVGKGGEDSSVLCRALQEFFVLFVLCTFKQRTPAI